MAFYSKGDQKVRLRFSRDTEEVIKNDMFLFGETKESTFINRVIENFYPDAKASIYMCLEEYKDTLSKSLMKNTQEDSLRVILKKMCNIEKERLQDLAASYGKPDKSCTVKSPYRLKNAIYHKFTESTDFQEDKYYESLPSYIKTLVEEYAHEPYIVREKIYFKEWFDMIADAIAKKVQLVITTSNGDVYYTLPYKVLSDPLATTNYLAGYSYRPGEGKDTKYTASYKIAAIRDMSIRKSLSGCLHSKERSALRTEIEEKGVQFLVSDYEEIRVRLTENGKRSFDRWLHLRPAPADSVKEGDAYIYTFQCSEQQARAYFFKLGAEAEILSPLKLRNEFSEKYQKAYERYRANGI